MLNIKQFVVNSLLSTVVFALVIDILFLSTVAGYKWIHVKPGNAIPAGAAVLSRGLKTYVGRARHYDEVLPAEVYNTSYALIRSCSKAIGKHDFEILVDVEDCTWPSISKIESVPENIVRVGNQWDGEPIYLAQSSDNYARVASILLTSKQILRWERASGDLYALTCKDNNEWVDAHSEKIQQNALQGGKSADDHDIYVARLKIGCDIVPGQVTPALGIATAIYEGNDIKSSYCQVLMKGASNYNWVPAQNGEIPDHAVFAAKSENNEIMYVAKINNTLGYIVYSEAVGIKGFHYDVLTKDEE